MLLPLIIQLLRMLTTTKFNHCARTLMGHTNWVHGSPVVANCPTLFYNNKPFMDMARNDKYITHMYLCMKSDRV